MLTRKYTVVLRKKNPLLLVLGLSKGGLTGLILNLKQREQSEIG